MQYKKAARIEEGGGGEAERGLNELEGSGAFSGRDDNKQRYQKCPKERKEQRSKTSIKRSEMALGRRIWA